MIYGISSLSFRPQIEVGFKPVKEPLRLLCCMVAYCIFSRFESLSGKLDIKKFKKIAADYFYGVYAKGDPPGFRKFVSIKREEIPASPNLTEVMLMDGKSYFGDQLPMTYEEGKAVVERTVAIGCYFEEYARQHLHEYEDPEYRKMMARRYFEDTLCGSMEKYREHEIYSGVAYFVCQKEINDIYWVEFKEKEREAEYKLLKPLMKTEADKENLELYLGDIFAHIAEFSGGYLKKEDLKESYFNGTPARVREWKVHEYRLQTPEEHRLEWDQMPIGKKINKLHRALGPWAGSVVLLIGFCFIAKLGLKIIDRL